MVGIKVDLYDYSIFPGLNAEKALAMGMAEVENLNADGHNASWCLLDLGRTDEAELKECIKERKPDIIMIGAGMRVWTGVLTLLEKVVNVVHREAEGIKICFPSSLRTSAEAVVRCLLDIKLVDVSISA